MEAVISKTRTWFEQSELMSKKDWMKSPHVEKNSEKMASLETCQNNTRRFREQISPLFECVIGEDMSVVKRKDDERLS